MSVPTLLVTGPGGVGKSTVAYEICRLLEARDVPHAMIDADELDRIHPAPPDDPHKTSLTYTNLAAIWANLRAAGAPRLILTMVASSPGDEIARVCEAIPGARVVTVRLRASEEDLLERVGEREIGSGHNYQVARTLKQASLMAQEDGRDRVLVDTTGKIVSDIAGEVLDRAGW